MPAPYLDDTAHLVTDAGRFDPAAVSVHESWGGRAADAPASAPEFLWHVELRTRTSRALVSAPTPEPRTDLPRLDRRHGEGDLVSVPMLAKLVSRLIELGAHEARGANAEPPPPAPTFAAVRITPETGIWTRFKPSTLVGSVAMIGVGLYFQTPWIIAVVVLSAVATVIQLMVLGRRPAPNAKRFRDDVDLTVEHGMRPVRVVTPEGDAELPGCRQIQVGVRGDSAVVLRWTARERRSFDIVLGSVDALPPLPRLPHLGDALPDQLEPGDPIGFFAALLETADPDIFDPQGSIPIFGKAVEQWRADGQLGPGGS